MLDSEQDWIDKYRAATAAVKPAAGVRLGNLVRRLADHVGRGLGEITRRRRSTQLTAPEPPVSSPPVLKSVHEGDDAA